MASGLAGSLACDGADAVSDVPPAGRVDGAANRHRPHRARNLRPPDTADIATAPVTDLTAARIRRRKILGGLIQEYERAA